LRGEIRRGWRQDREGRSFDDGRGPSTSCN
jgi:hypothetical protein